MLYRLLRYVRLCTVLKIYTVCIVSTKNKYKEGTSEPKYTKIDWLHGENCTHQTKNLLPAWQFHLHIYLHSHSYFLPRSFIAEQMWSVCFGPIPWPGSWILSLTSHNSCCSNYPFHCLYFQPFFNDYLLWILKYTHISAILKRTVFSWTQTTLQLLSRLFLLKATNCEKVVYFSLCTYSSVYYAFL